MLRRWLFVERIIVVLCTLLSQIFVLICEPVLSLSLHFKLRKNIGKLLRSLLNRITSPVVFFDIDIAFVGDPAPYLSRVLEQFDICVQTERRALFPPLYCTSVMGFRPSLFSHQVLDQLDRIAQIDPERVPDGVAFNRLRNADPTFVKSVFPLPETIFCNGFNGHLVNPPPFDRLKDQAQPILVHANWMVGVEAKQDYLKSLGLWRLS